MSWLSKYWFVEDAEEVDGELFKIHEDSIQAILAKFIKKEGIPGVGSISFVKKARGKLVADWLAQDAILEFVMNLLNQLKLEELRSKERASGKWFNQFTFSLKGYMTKHFRNEDENYLK